MRHRSRLVPALTLALVAPATLGATWPDFDVGVTVNGLRSARGQVLACLTARPTTYPDCNKDPEARRLTAPAEPSLHLDFGAVPGGVYAISVIHDENGNGRLDKRLMMPVEGYGFSRNAPVHFGPPSFRSASFEVDAPAEEQSIRMRYLF